MPSGRTLSIKVKVVGMIVLSLGVVAALLGYFITSFLNDRIQATAEEAVKSAAETFANLERASVRMNNAMIDNLQLNKEVMQAYIDRDRPKLWAMVGPMYKRFKAQHGITHWLFVNPDQICFLRVHKPEIVNDFLDRAILKEAIRTGQMAWGKELGRVGLALRVTRPFMVDGKANGYVEMGEELTPFLANMRKQTGDHYALVLRKAMLDQRTYSTARKGLGAADNWTAQQDLVVANSTTADETLFNLTGAELQSVDEKGLVLERRKVGDSMVVRGVFPFKDAAGKQVGGVIVLRDVTKLQSALESAKQQGAIAAVVLVLLVAGLIYFMLQRLVFGRLQDMMKRMIALSQQITAGDYAAADNAPLGTDDEIGRFETFFAGFASFAANTMRESRESKK